MNDERLVPVHQARDAWEANLVAGYLRDNGVDATLDAKISRAESSLHAGYVELDTRCGVFVLEHDRARGRQLVAEFLSAATDEAVLADEAAQKLRVDAAAIHRLRGELQEERRTFEFLEWLGIVVMGAAAVLWIIWPPWLKAIAPVPGLRWILLILLVSVAGSWARSKM